MKNKTVIIFFTLLIGACPGLTRAEWSIVTQNAADGTVTITAHTTNKQGYSLDIYRDANNVVRTHFSMNASQSLDGKTCPTYQVDQRQVENRSTNDAPCLIQARWAEYIIGYIANDRIESTAMHNLLNGNTIALRFIVQNAGYAETSFSLTGSKRVIMEALGRNLVVSTDNNQP